MLPTPRELREALFLSFQQAAFIEASRRSIQQILQGTDRRFAIIAGPCSIHDRKSALEYARRFKELASQVSKSCFLVMRVYMEKPRTTTGWKGYLYDPFLDGSYDIRSGLFSSRELLIQLAAMEIPTAAEFVDPLAAPYFADLISWGFIGARTSASQPHRQLASLLQLPIGFKNGTDGNIDHALHGVLTAQHKHTFLYMNDEGKVAITASPGNPLTHVVLRGSWETTNYDPESIAFVKEKMDSLMLNSKILIDCSHGNCQKLHERQKNVFYSVIEQIEAGNDAILGVMLESHLQAGSQPIDFPLDYAVSITDPCIDWSTTEELILHADALLSEKTLYTC
jgi:3-deoxy-7-phosphoheptulonate synthase